VWVSGLAGRYIYARIPRSKLGVELTIEEIGARRKDLLEEIARASGLAPDLIDTTLAAGQAPVARRGLWGTLWRMVADDLARRRAARKLRRLWKRVVPTGARTTGKCCGRCCGSPVARWRWRSRHGCSTPRTTCSGTGTCCIARGDCGSDGRAHPRGGRGRSWRDVAVVRYGLVALALTCFGRSLAAQISPGPLAKPHQYLEGALQCVQCHGGGPKEQMTARCLACHKEIGWLVGRGRGSMPACATSAAPAATPIMPGATLRWSAGPVAI